MSELCTFEFCFICPVRILGSIFIQRWDLYAQQNNDGSYVCIHKPLSTDLLLAHLLGDITLGTYVLNKNNEARFIVLDADDEEGYTRLSLLSLSLLHDNVPSYLEASRRGGHLWLFFALPIRGIKARAFALGLLNAHHISNIEVFPKQDALSGGPGSLIRMPFGFHRLTKQRYGFSTPDGRSLAPTIMKQIQAMDTIKTVPADTFKRYSSISNTPTSDEKIKKVVDSNGLVSDQIRSIISVMDFVGRYVDLKSTPNGAIGLCPFHDDHRPSFGVNDEGNYWHCFAGCGGGSVIDFWMKWRDCDFSTAVSELAHMLL